MSDDVTEARRALTDHEQMLDAMAACVPCKLCGGKAVISDAGRGAGYFINCGNSASFHVSKGCLIGQRRLGGWAYNVMDWWNRLHTVTPSPDSGERMREALEEGRPFSEWHEDHGDVLWWKLPILESPYCGSPIDLGRSMKVVVQIGFEEHDMPITMTGGWPFSDDDEESLWWTPLPKPTFARAALQESAR